MDHLQYKCTAVQSDKERVKEINMSLNDTFSLQLFLYLSKLQYIYTTDNSDPRKQTLFLFNSSLVFLNKCIYTTDHLLPYTTFEFYLQIAHLSD